MQKICKLSCCVECPSHTLIKNEKSFCTKMNRLIENSLNDPINFALIEFPDWCPLESDENVIIDYRKEIKNILKIIANDFNSLDSISEASHYLNSVIENAKK